jgi:hypothetical protein
VVRRLIDQTTTFRFVSISRVEHRGSICSKKTFFDQSTFVDFDMCRSHKSNVGEKCKRTFSIDRQHFDLCRSHESNVGQICKTTFFDRSTTFRSVSITRVERRCNTYVISTIDFSPSPNTRKWSRAFSHENRVEYFHAKIE